MIQSQKAADLILAYRLPFPEELHNYSAKEGELLDDGGIRLVRFQIPSRYYNLATYLASRMWKEADAETLKVMLEVSGRERDGYLDLENIKTFPCEDLKMIDQLWVQASNGHFGFSVQKKIYQRCGGTERYNERVWNRFSNTVGWKKGESWLYYKDLTFDLSAAEGHLPWFKLFLFYFNRFSNTTVGWKKGESWLYYKDLTFDLSAAEGHLPCLVQS